MAAKDAAASKWHENLSSLAALVHALEQTPPDVATLAELSDLLAKAKTATDRLLAQRPADTPVVVIHESLDETLNAQLAALSVLEVAFKVGDVYCYDNQFRKVSVLFVVKNFRNNFFFFGICIQAVCTGKIEQFSHTTVGQIEFPPMLFHGHSWEVSHLLIHTCEQVEQRGLGCIRAAD